MSGSGHYWGGPNRDRCELCGDKDWMADKFCSKNPSVKKNYDEWLESLKNEKHEPAMSVGN